MRFSELKFKKARINAEGKIFLDENEVTDKIQGATLLKNMVCIVKGPLFSKWNEQNIVVEAFDQPFIALNVYEIENIWSLELNYGVHVNFSLDSLRFDDWGRINGHTDNRIPFVMNPEAQHVFIQLIGGLIKDTFLFNNKNYKIDDYWSISADARDEQFWSYLYNTEYKTVWNINEASPLLVQCHIDLNPSPSKIIILGSGEGFDAAYFAEHQHEVTAVDFSQEAIELSRKRFGHFKNIKWISHDMFKLDDTYNCKFDFVIENNCFCAIDPTERNQLIKLWYRLLKPDGKLLGSFTMYDIKKGPPFGCTEFELDKRLLNIFKILKWQRWTEVKSKLGVDLCVIAQKIS